MLRNCVASGTTAHSDRSGEQQRQHERERTFANPHSTTSYSLLWLHSSARIATDRRMLLSRRCYSSSRALGPLPVRRD